MSLKFTGCALVVVGIGFFLLIPPAFILWLMTTASLYFHNAARSYAGHYDNDLNLYGGDYDGVGASRRSINNVILNFYYSGLILVISLLCLLGDMPKDTDVSVTGVRLYQLIQIGNLVWIVVLIGSISLLTAKSIYLFANTWLKEYKRKRILAIS